MSGGVILVGNIGGQRVAPTFTCLSDLSRLTGASIKPFSHVITPDETWKPQRLVKDSLSYSLWFLCAVHLLFIMSTTTEKWRHRSLMQGYNLFQFFPRSTNVANVSKDS